MARVSWTSQGLADIKAIEDFIARDAPSVAQVVVDKIFQSVERLRTVSAFRADSTGN